MTVVRHSLGVVTLAAALLTLSVAPTAFAGREHAGGHRHATDIGQPGQAAQASRTIEITGRKVSSVTPKPSSSGYVRIPAANAVLAGTPAGSRLARTTVTLPEDSEILVGIVQVAAIMLLAALYSSVTHNFVDDVTSYRILLGAEIDELIHAGTPRLW